MTTTTAAFVATEEFKGLFADYPYNEAEETQSKWNDDVATDGDYEIAITPTGYVSLQDPDTIDEAFTQVGNNGLVQYLLNTWACLDA
ncbi:hypothetical protein [Halococcoides cellulosivorans]|uniref:Uncharacterized protein n=1 Tax=Halococcoides cellulosivorans TaxID=1679096 RepID=A0A2R4X3Z7_9EURY|nr:hypothetical protein [Halococcoides cellulosivorans]AWB28525.1 hypothetical protein HARCEL1_12950 [Halococcoides cellulosivorans]